MFDQKNVVVGNYDETGYAVTQTIYNQDDDISQFLDLRTKLLATDLISLTKPRSN